MRAHGRESHNHEVSLSHRFGELMSVMQADDPDAVARGPFPRAHAIQASMRRAQIQKKGDFDRGDVALLNRYAKVARTGEVSMDIGPKARISGSLRCLPLAEFGSVFASFHMRRLSSTLTYRRNRATIARTPSHEPPISESQLMSSRVRPLIKGDALCTIASVWVQSSPTATAYSEARR